jgi:hypothetical protein
MVECVDEEIDFTECGCRFDKHACINVRGKGTPTNPFRLLFNFSEDPDQILECDTYGDGMFAEMQDRFIWPTMRKVRDIPVPLNANDPIPFSTVEYDPYGISSVAEVAVIPFDAKWRVSAYANFDNNDGSFNTIRLEFHKGVAYGVISANRESRDRDVVHESFISLTDEFAMRTGDKVRITIGEDAKDRGGSAVGTEVGGPVTILRASMVVTLVSL